MIALDSLSFQYQGAGEQALKDISLQIPAGQFMAVIGANGAGKSTFCYAVSGYIPHFFPGDYRGSVQVAGMHLASTPLSALSQKIGLVLQNPLNQISGAKYSVAEEIAFGLENLGINRQEMHRRVEQVMAQVGIGSLANKSPYALSGGQQQKMIIAAVLVMQPQVLVLDEPTAQLDPSGAEDIFCLLKKLCMEGLTVLMAEHRVELVAQYADRVAALAGGSLLLEGSPEEVLTSSRLEQNGIPVPRLTSLARRAKDEGIWPVERGLPVQLEEAVEGFSGVKHGN